MIEVGSRVRLGDFNPCPCETCSMIRAKRIEGTVEGVWNEGAPGMDFATVRWDDADGFNSCEWGHHQDELVVMHTVNVEIPFE